MRYKKPRKPKKQQPIKKNIQVEQPKINSNTFKKSLYNNLIAIPIILMVLFIIYDSDPGYKWAWVKLLKANFEKIEKNKNADYQKKQEIRFGFYARYLYLICENTPEDAIIIMPPDSIINAVDNKYNLTKLKNKKYTTYFVYPRKIVYEKNKEDADLYKKATHIAIVNFYGYQFVNYNIPEKQQFSIIPLTLKK